MATEQKKTLNASSNSSGHSMGSYSLRMTLLTTNMQNLSLNLDRFQIVHKEQHTTEHAFTDFLETIRPDINTHLQSDNRKPWSFARFRSFLKTRGYTRDNLDALQRAWQGSRDAQVPVRAFFAKLKQR